MPFAATWMDLELTLLCEIRERQIQYHLHVESKQMIQMNLNRKTEIESQT